MSQMLCSEGTQPSVGTLYGIHQNLTVQANGQLTNAEEYRQLIVAYRNGAPVMLRDLATWSIVSKTIDSPAATTVSRW